jgi:hypothetical protein
VSPKHPARPVRAGRIPLSEAPGRSYVGVRSPPLERTISPMMEPSKPREQSEYPAPRGRGTPRAHFVRGSVWASS